MLSPREEEEGLCSSTSTLMELKWLASMSALFKRDSSSALALRLTLSIFFWDSGSSLPTGASASSTAFLLVIVMGGLAAPGTGAGGGGGAPFKVVTTGVNGLGDGFWCIVGQDSFFGG